MLALAKARASGKPVFVWMTADWCITCKVNERTAIEREATAAAFRKAGVVVLRGDWTRRDPAITRFLTTNGAAGVPFYLWYPAGGGQRPSNCRKCSPRACWSTSPSRPAVEIAPNRSKPRSISKHGQPRLTA